MIQQIFLHGIPVPVTEVAVFGPCPAQNPQATFSHRVSRHPRRSGRRMFWAREFTSCISSRVLGMPAVPGSLLAQT
jgi:hypothetical protein